jgi:hypothetical protein
MGNTKAGHDALNHPQHDFLVELAEGMDPYVACEAVGWKHKTLRGQLYKLMEALEVSPQGDFDKNIDALKGEALARGYNTEPTYLMYDRQEQIDELGGVLPRWIPVLPRPS